MTLERFKANLNTILDMLRLPSSPWHSPTTQLVLLTPPPVDDTTRNAELASRVPARVPDRDAERTRLFAEAVKDVGREGKVPVVDVWGRIMQFARDNEGGRLDKYLSDGLHLTAEGYRIVTAGASRSGRLCWSSCCCLEKSRWALTRESSTVPTQASRSSSLPSTLTCTGTTWSSASRTGPTSSPPRSAFRSLSLSLSVQCCIRVHCVSESRAREGSCAAAGSGTAKIPLACSQLSAPQPSMRQGATQQREREREKGRTRSTRAASSPGQICLLV